MKNHFKLFSALLAGFSAFAGSASAEEWTVLFDGQPTKTLRGYNQGGFPTNNWVIDHGALKTVPGKPVDLVTTEKYTNFELEFEWKLGPRGNSGVMYNVAETDGPPWSTGPEMQINDDVNHPDGKNPKTSAGALYALLASTSNKTLKPIGEFNTAKLIIKDGHVEHWLNGAKVLTYEWNSPELREAITKTKFASMPGFMKEKGGYVCFQHHGEEAWFRNMRIRRF